MNKGGILLSTVRRGAAPDELELVDQAGHVILLHAHGVHDDERHRTRERAWRLLFTALRRPQLAQERF